jgi:hypothetical protein
MLTQKDIKRLASKLPKYSVDTIRGVTNILSVYSSLYVVKKNKPPTIKEFATDLPYLLVFTFKELTDINLSSLKLSYQVFKEVIDTAVQLNILTYSPEDNISDLDISTDLIFDAKAKSTKTARDYIHKKFA